MKLKIITAILMLLVILPFGFSTTATYSSSHSGVGEEVKPSFNLFTWIKNLFYTPLEITFPDGYDSCCGKDTGYKNHCAFAKVHPKMCYAKPETKYCPGVGNYVTDYYAIKYKCTGIGDITKAYIDDDGYFPYCSWEIKGCSGTSAPTNTGEYIIRDTVGKVENKPYTFVCSDYDRDDCGGYWAAIQWAWGWSKIYPGTVYVLNCCDDSDCGTGMFCDKTGSYTEWSCKADPCYNVKCDDYCEGSTKYTNGKCVEGICQYTETTAKDHCVGNTIYRSGNCTNGEITYTQIECEDKCKIDTYYIASCKDADCSYTTIKAEDICVGDKRYYNGKCKHKCKGGICIIPLPYAYKNDYFDYYSEEYCPYGCTDGKCNPDKCINKTCPDKCIGDNLTTYKCNSFTGLCDFNNQTYCTYGCTDGKCNPYTTLGEIKNIIKDIINYIKDLYNLILEKI